MFCPQTSKNPLRPWLCYAVHMQIQLCMAWLCPMSCSQGGSATTFYARGSPQKGENDQVPWGHREKSREKNDYTAKAAERISNGNSDLEEFSL